MGSTVPSGSDHRDHTDHPPADERAWRSLAATLERPTTDLHAMRSVLDGLPLRVLVCDLDLVITYANRAAMAGLELLAEHLPVRPSEVVGSSLDIFHANPAHQRRVLSSDAGLPVDSLIRVGPETLDLHVQAVYDDSDGTFCGAVATWDLVTARVQAEREAAEQLSSKVDQILEVVSVAATGDFTRQITVRGEDPVGRLGEGVESLLQIVRVSLAEIARTAEALATAAEELMSLSGQLDDGAHLTSDRAVSASAAAQQVTDSLQSVASAAEEMTVSISEIARNASDAAAVATTAVNVAGGARATVTSLGESSAEIGAVIKVITSIAQQTNLLALNATIEAARAGDAGKGFAVVANEVKELAKETAKATEDVGRKIEAIQTDARGAVEGIGEIATIIDRVSDFQTTIASAVEEQSVTTNEISRSVTEAALGSNGILGNISAVADAAGDGRLGAAGARRQAGSLAEMAVELRRLLGRFSY